MADDSWLWLIAEAYASRKSASPIPSPSATSSLHRLPQERPAEQDRLVEHMDHVAQQDIRQARLTALDPRPGFRPGPQLLIAGEVVLAHLVRERDGHLDDVLVLDEVGLRG